MTWLIVIFNTTGAHHAAYDCGAGFCIWNDLVIAGEALVAAKCISHYLIIDLDVHQGFYCDDEMC